MYSFERNIRKESYQSQKQFKGIILGRGWRNFQIFSILCLAKSTLTLKILLLIKKRVLDDT